MIKELITRVGKKLGKSAQGEAEESKDFITNKRLRGVWNSRVTEDSHYTELEAFQDLTGCHDLSTLEFLIFISILIYVRWDAWSEFQTTFGSTLDSDCLRPLGSGSPLTWHVIQKHLFPEEEILVRDFFEKQFIFLPILITEHQELRECHARARLPVLEERNSVRSGFYGKVFKVQIAEEQYAYNAEGVTNPIVSHTQDIGCKTCLIHSDGSWLCSPKRSP